MICVANLGNAEKALRYGFDCIPLFDNLTCLFPASEATLRDNAAIRQKALVPMVKYTIISFFLAI